MNVQADSMMMRVVARCNSELCGRELTGSHLMSTDDAADYERAMKWLKELTDDVLRLRLDERVWREVQEIIASNPKLHIPSEFYRWMRDMYVSGIAMGIRRLTDDDTRAVSLLRFLKLVKGNSSIVSRRRYRALFKKEDSLVQQLDELGFTKGYIDEGYDQLVGEGKSQPTAEDIQAEIDELQRVTGKFVTFATKVIAHKDQQRPDELPKFGEVDEAVAYFEQVIQRYQGLLRATHLSMEVTFQYDWKAVFRVPWIQRG